MGRKRYKNVDELPDPSPCKTCGSNRRRLPSGQIFCKKCRSDYHRDYVGKNRSDLLAYYKNRYESNKGAILAKQKIYYEENKETVLQKSKERWAGKRAEYKVRQGMIGRCYVKSNPSYDKYGGRGITVCRRWLDSFDNFFEDMGPRPSSKHSIERKNVNGNYEPGNCRWATPKEQANNRTNTVSNRLSVPDTSPIIYRNEIITLDKFSELTSIPLEVVKYRFTQNPIDEWIIYDEYDNRYYEYKGHKYNMVELAILHKEPFSKLSYIQMSQRIKKYGWSVEKSVETPYR